MSHPITLNAAGLNAFSDPSQAIETLTKGDFGFFEGTADLGVVAKVQSAEISDFNRDGAQDVKIRYSGGYEVIIYNHYAFSEGVDSLNDQVMLGATDKADDLKFLRGKWRGLNQAIADFAGNAQQALRVNFDSGTGNHGHESVVGQSRDGQYVILAQKSDHETRVEGTTMDLKDGVDPIEQQAMMRALAMPGRTPGRETPDHYGPPTDTRPTDVVVPDVPGIPSLPGGQEQTTHFSRAAVYTSADDYGRVAAQLYDARLWYKDVNLQQQVDQAVHALNAAQAMLDAANKKYETLPDTQAGEKVRLGFQLPKLEAAVLEAEAEVAKWQTLRGQLSAQQGVVEVSYQNLLGDERLESVAAVLLDNRGVAQRILLTSPTQ